MTGPTPTVDPVTPAFGAGGVLTGADLPDLPGRVLGPAELREWVVGLAAREDVWRAHVARRAASGGRHFVGLHRDTDLDVWLLCWDTSDDTGWHDHDTSAGAVVVTDGAVVERRPRLGGVPAARVVRAGQSFAFGPDHIHRMAGHVDGSVSIHAYSPPLWRMGQYAISDDGVMRRWSVSYADELRPVDA